MNTPTTDIHIRNDPLSGADAVRIGSRIVIWDHQNDKTVFAGKITRIIDGDRAIGENYVHNQETDGKLSETTRLSFEVIGLVPLRGTRGDFNPQYRTYALPIEAAPTYHKRFRVAYKTPEQLRALERAEARRRSPSSGGDVR